MSGIWWKFRPASYSDVWPSGIPWPARGIGLTEITFHIVNFERFCGRGVGSKLSGHSENVRAKLEAKGWEVVSNAPIALGHRLSAKIPNNLANLTKYSQGDIAAPADGPQVVTALRNAIVHGKQRRLIPKEVIIEGWLLSLWYLELLILRLLNYKGYYWNRIAGDKAIRPADEVVASR